MTKVHLVVPDIHAHPDHHNNRADWLGKLILDLKPDVVINMGDAADLASLSSYDKGKASFYGRSYEKDIESHLDFQTRMWEPIRRAKKKRPYAVVLEGNHEHRIKRALDTSPELKGHKHGLSFEDLAFSNYYQHIVEYEGNTPGQTTIDGVLYSHYLPSGLMGRPIGGEHHASSLLSKYHISCTVSHSHTVDYCMRSTPYGKIQGLVSGVFQDYATGWAGGVNRMWWHGLVIKRNVEGGTYDPEFVSIERLRKEYE